jgi:hypothetical protein
LQKSLRSTLQGVQKKLENSLSLGRLICAKCAKGLRTCRSPEDCEIIRCRSRQVEADPRVRGFRLRKNCKERNSNIVKDKVQGDSRPLDPGGPMAEIHVFGGRTLQRKFKEDNT